MQLSIPHKMVKGLRFGSEMARKADRQPRKPSNQGLSERTSRLEVDDPRGDIEEPGILRGEVHRVREEQSQYLTIST